MAIKSWQPSKLFFQAFSNHGRYDKVSILVKKINFDCCYLGTREFFPYFRMKYFSIPSKQLQLFHEARLPRECNHELIVRRGEI
jgi:hypothetical protein